MQRILTLGSVHTGPERLAIDAHHLPGKRLLKWKRLHVEARPLEGCFQLRVHRQELMQERLTVGAHDPGAIGCWIGEEGLVAHVRLDGNEVRFDVERIEVREVGVDA